MITKFLCLFLVFCFPLILAEQSNFEACFDVEDVRGCSLFEDLIPTGFDSLMKFNTRIQEIADESDFDQQQGYNLHIITLFKFQPKLELSMIRVYDQRRSLYDTVAFRKEVEFFYRRQIEVFDGLGISPLDSCSSYIHSVKILACG